ncbi:MAG: BON domain-containing protein [Acidobacteria bacterium]|nr:BON domain-containing protein [Acidobacteriota bacterium]
MGRRIFAIAAVALFLAAALQPAEAPDKTQPKGAAPRWKDNELKKAIEARFSRSAIAADHFRVEVKEGAAYITGKTDVMQHKGVATRLARSVGAKEVHNEVEVSEAARQKAAAQLARGRKAAAK